ncbi:Alpha/beta knot methyltransferase [Pilaira anomala]|nr:Alpha/beta knot methyltransferase [Pilaira anomala]
MLSFGSRVFIRNYTYTKVNPITAKYRPATRNPWDHVYGLSSVLAALRSKKRSVMGTLYILESDKKKTTQKKDSRLMEEILQLSKESKIYVVPADKGRLNNLTDNKTHQGVVLQASTRNPIEITALSPINNNQYEAFPRVNKRGSEEDREQNSQKELSTIKFEQPNRKPFWIALDEVQDPQNLGSILRTAYFYGVDGVLLCSKNSAPLSPAVSKVSSGAAELMDIYSSPNLVKFLKESNENGWDIIGAAGEESDSSISLSQFRQHTAEKPVILVLGNEGTGLRTNIKNNCQSFVSIPNAAKDDLLGSIDSLNVGVAAGVLISDAISV